MSVCEYVCVRVFFLLRNRKGACVLKTREERVQNNAIHEQFLYVPRTYLDVQNGVYAYGFPSKSVSHNSFKSARNT